jgi:peptide/nickel transport system permease protein
MDAVQAIPGLVLALAIVSVLKPNTTNAMLAIAMVIIPGNSRIVRGAVLAAKQNRYVEAAQALGCQQPRIVITHILPNVTAPILIIASIWLGNAILIEASLSFLGLGTQPPTPSWGLMLSSTGRAFMEQAPWLAIFPGLAISMAVLGFNLFGDTLRDAWDPKLRASRAALFVPRGEPSLPGAPVSASGAAGGRCPRRSRLSPRRRRACGPWPRWCRG